MTYDFGSSAFVVLSNKVKAARVGLGRQCTPTQCVRDNFLWETSLNADRHWFHGRTAQWMSTGNAEEPDFLGQFIIPCIVSHVILLIFFWKKGSMRECQVKRIKIKQMPHGVVGHNLLLKK